MTKQERIKFENKVSLHTGRNKGRLDVNSAYEIADDMGVDVTKRQAQNAIRRSAENYGY